MHLPSIELEKQREGLGSISAQELIAGIPNILESEARGGGITLLVLAHLRRQNEVALGTS